MNETKCYFNDILMKSTHLRESTVLKIVNEATVVKYC